MNANYNDENSVVDTADASLAPPPATSLDRVAPPASRRWLFVLTILTGSFLLFLIQPMVARMAMPRLGGAPAVWNSAQLVYQALLLGGYAYAHFLSRLAPKRQTMIHIGLFLVAALWLPVGLIAANPPANEGIILFVPWLLAASIGPLFLAVAAQAPLMQRWFHFHAPDANPYPLYAASNIGSFAGLLAYPLLVEPNLGNSAQSWLWTGIYALLLALIGFCAFTVYKDNKGIADAADAERDAITDADEPAPDLARKLRWVLYAAVPSGLMLSTTTHLTTDIMAMPLLWVIPLGLYLLSFSIAFADRRVLADLIVFLSPFIILILGGTALLSGTNNLPMMLLGSVTLLFVVAVAMHSLMYRDRPSPKYLTQFYLLMSVGGVIGGIFCALLAPVIFDWVYEHPILILAAALLIPQNSLFPFRRAGGIGTIPQIVIAAAILAWSLYHLYHNGSPTSADMAYYVIPLLLVGIWMVGNRPAYLMVLLAIMGMADGWDKAQPRLDAHRTRSYFGVYNVYADSSDNLQKLVNGTTLHGLQNLDPAKSKEPTSYYGHGSGVGIVLDRATLLYPQGARVGIVGLGAGTLACYAQPDQQWHFYEIDPVMVNIAKDPKHFSFLSQCASNAKMHVGDARLTIAEQAPQSLDILVIDAFSSDAIPMHLMTKEAFDVYRRVLSPDGVLVVHISNRYFDLEPVLHAEAEKGKWFAASRWDYPDAEDPALTASTWIAMSPDQQTLYDATHPFREGSAQWQGVRGRKGFNGWTDDYGSVLPLVKIWDKDEE